MATGSSRAEGGTNPRGVWLDLQLARIEAAVERGACGEARRRMAALTRPVPRLPFTRDGLPEQLARDGRERRLSSARQRCG